MIIEWRLLDFMRLQVPNLRYVIYLINVSPTLVDKINRRQPWFRLYGFRASADTVAVYICSSSIFFAYHVGIPSWSPYWKISHSPSHSHLNWSPYFAK